MAVPKRQTGGKQGDGIQGDVRAYVRFLENGLYRRLGGVPRKRVLPVQQEMYICTNVPLMPMKRMATKRGGA